VRGVERSGSLVVKIAQYLSHRHIYKRRSDLLSPQMIKKLQHLREMAPIHPFSETIKMLIANNIFEEIREIQEKPIASGIIGQVYRAKLQTGQELIVKVRHPAIMQQLKMDLNLVFGFTDSVSRLWGCGWLKIPLTYNELLKVIIEQADFRIEGSNLRRFKKNFEGLNNLIQFPDVYYESEDLLVENFIENAASIQEFKDYPEPLKRRLCSVGMNSFFKMFVYDNFIHADCHAGNLLVQKKKRKKLQTPYYKQFYNKLENQVYYLFNKGYYSACKLYIQCNYH